MMPAGPILLAVLLVSIAFGLLDRPLERMGLRPLPAALLVAAMLLGSLIELPLVPHLSINLGAGLLPVAVSLWLLATADTWYEPARAVMAAALTAAAVLLIEQWFPPGQPTELNLFYLDAQYLYGVIGGVAGGLAAGSRRAAFIAGVLGVVLGDLAHFLGIGGMGEAVPVRTAHLGGGGFHGTTIVAGVLALLLAEGVALAGLLDGKGEIPHNESDG